MQKPMIFTEDKLVWSRVHLSDFQIRGIYHYLNELLQELHNVDSVDVDAECDFGMVYADGNIECTEYQSANWLIPNDAELSCYTIRRFYLSDNDVLYADIEHDFDENDVKVVRIN